MDSFGCRQGCLLLGKIIGIVLFGTFELLQVNVIIQMHVHVSNGFHSFFLFKYYVYNLTMASIFFN